MKILAELLNDALERFEVSMPDGEKVEDFSILKDWAYAGTKSLYTIDLLDERIEFEDRKVEGCRIEIRVNFETIFESRLLTKAAGKRWFKTIIEKINLLG